MDALNITESITIAAPPGTIFAILTDPKQHSRIDGSGTLRGNVIGDEQLRKGSKFRMDMKLGVPYKISNKVVEFEQDRRIAWRHFGAHRWRYELADQGEATTVVTETWDVSRYHPLIRKALSWKFAKDTTGAIHQTLGKLKEAAEADHRGTDPAPSSHP